jgi:hypothetical protein
MGKLAVLPLSLPALICLITKMDTVIANLVIIMSIGDNVCE